MIAKALATYLPPVLGIALILFLVWSTLEMHHHAQRMERVLQQMPVRCP